MADRIPAVATALLALVVAMAACSPATSTPQAASRSPSIPPGATASATADLTPVPSDPGTTPRPTLPGQTDTDWGRIWDGLPIGFPAWPGARPTETGAGPASAILDAGGSDPAEVATFYQSALRGADYSTVSMSGPGEDGSWAIEAAEGEAGCHVRTTVTPLGASTFVTIMFGADCRFE